MKRVDLLLVEKGVAPSRTKAKELIERQAVFVCGENKPVKNPSQSFAADVEFEVRNAELLKYVSRGGLKLESALKAFSLDVLGLRVLDLGASTGGFTDCLLQAGVQHVDSVDIGRDQLHPKLKTNPKVSSFEGQDVRGFEGGPYGLIVADLSFISLTKVLDDISRLADKGTQVLLLVKPQFEVGSAHIGRGGLVKDLGAVQEALDRIGQILSEKNFSRIAFRASSLKGRDGNQEFFVYAYMAE